ncbi:MAG: methyltransferase domain-containing protein [Myxococcota bacterium]
MKTKWDYTALADAYLKRAPYSRDAILALLDATGTRSGDRVADIGAGTGNLSVELLASGLQVSAVEPNDAMRKHGVARTKGHEQIVWSEGVGEATGLDSNTYALVTFGSSFNVTHRPQALAESARLLKPGGWFACMWNHRDLEDDLQSSIEAVIREQIPAYAYGTRREDQQAVIDASGLFGEVQRFEGTLLHTQTVEDCMEAWRSHGTLQRQAGDRFKDVIDAIAALLDARNLAELAVPYTTRIWAAPLR